MICWDVVLCNVSLLPNTKRRLLGRNLRVSARGTTRPRQREPHRVSINANCINISCTFDVHECKLLLLFFFFKFCIKNVKVPAVEVKYAKMSTKDAVAPATSQGENQN